MDFFARQERARRATAVLVAYFSVAVVLLTGAVYVAVKAIVVGVDVKARGALGVSTALWDPPLLGGVAVATLLVIAAGTTFKTMQLAKGGSVVATLLGGRLVNHDTTEPN